MAEAQLRLRRHDKPELPFRKAYIYGPSTHNVKIESWWRLLSKAQTEQWKQLFGNLSARGFFNGSWYDVTALQYIYMQVIREQIAVFVEAHNNHRIRNQDKTRPYLPTGRPFQLYHHPGTRHYARKADQDLLNSLLQKVEDWSPEEYITQDVSDFCDRIIEEEGKRI